MNMAAVLTTNTWISSGYPVVRTGQRICSVRLVQDKHLIRMATRLCGGARGMFGVMNRALGSVSQIECLDLIQSSLPEYTASRCPLRRFNLHHEIRAHLDVRYCPCIGGVLYEYR